MCGIQRIHTHSTDNEAFPISAIKQTNLVQESFSITQRIALKKRKKTSSEPFLVRIYAREGKEMTEKIKGNAA